MVPLGRFSCTRFAFGLKPSRAQVPSFGVIKSLLTKSFQRVIP